jgi:hypothetical protein
MKKFDQTEIKETNFILNDQIINKKVNISGRNYQNSNETIRLHTH